MGDVSDFDAFNKRKADASAQEYRTYLMNFAKRIADIAIGGVTLYPLSLQCVCAGWKGYLDMGTTVDWWLPACVPTFQMPEPDSKSLKFSFYNFRCVDKPEDRELIFEVELFAKVRTEQLGDEDPLKVLEEGVNNLKLEGAKNPLTAMLCILFFARKDMGFKLKSFEVDGLVLTITCDALTERMVITTYAEQFVKLLATLKETVERWNRRSKEDIETDWTVFKPSE